MWFITFLFFCAFMFFHYDAYSKRFFFSWFLFVFQLYKGRINATSHVIQHPMYGAGHKFRTLHLPVSTTLSDVLDRVSGKSYLSMNFVEVCVVFKWYFISFIISCHCIYAVYNPWLGNLKISSFFWSINKEIIK